MAYRNQIKPISTLPLTTEAIRGISNIVGVPGLQLNSHVSSKETSDYESNFAFDESSYLKLRPFSKLDPTLVRLVKFLNCFGIFVNINEANRDVGNNNSSLFGSRIRGYLRIAVMIFAAVLSAEVIYDVNLRQSKLLVEQKRSTPLLTFVIVAYSWLSLVIPIICNLSLVYIGPNLFRFYSRTTATVCNGMFFGKNTKVDSWYYYLTIVILAFLDVAGQVVLLGIWPESIDSYMRMILISDPKKTSFDASLDKHKLSMNISNQFESDLDSPLSEQQVIKPKIKAYLIDTILGEKYAHGDVGVIIKILCLMMQFIHSYVYLAIIISLSHHYATVINSINENLNRYEFRRLLRQLIILRDSSEQISLIISVPFSLVTTLAFMRQIALNGVFIQSTMLPYENWAVSLQSFTCAISIIMVFIYCDGLQSASKQAHRLKTEQTVIYENKGGNQSIYEFLDYLDRLSKSIRITFFNIISINKSSLISLYGHILTLTFVIS